MTIRRLVEPPEPALADALEAFECTFVYPLGEGRTFRISHGRDYPRFFRAIDPSSAASFIAIDRAGGVLGTLSVAVRPVRFPDGESRLAAYLGDLKTAPGPTRGRALLRLGAEATEWSKAHGAVAAYGIVMNGTLRIPSDYTGRFGIHAFREVGSVGILRLSVACGGVEKDGGFDSEASAVEAAFRRLAGGGFAPMGGCPEVRSGAPPVALLAPDGSACGILEDTRLAKRLIAGDGVEMSAAHLSKFACANPAAGVRLIRQALVRCARHAGAPALFVALPETQLDDVAALLAGDPGLVKTAAAIYGTELPSVEAEWHISTSEI